MADEEEDGSTTTEETTVAVAAVTDTGMIAIATIAEEMVVDTEGEIGVVVVPWTIEAATAEAEAATDTTTTEAAVAATGITTIVDAAEAAATISAEDAIDPPTGEDLPHEAVVAAETIDAAAVPEADPHRVVEITAETIGEAVVVVAEATREVLLEEGAAATTTIARGLVVATTRITEVVVVAAVAVTTTINADVLLRCTAEETIVEETIAGTVARYTD